jgi:hypothetical protein
MTAGVHVVSITTGGDESEQVYAGFYGNLTAQVHPPTLLPPSYRLPTVNGF